MSDLRKAIESAVNDCAAENGSNTPDFILASYLADCLTAFDKHVLAREDWYGQRRAPGSRVLPGKGTQEDL